MSPDTAARIVQSAIKDYSRPCFLFASVFPVPDRARASCSTAFTYTLGDLKGQTAPGIYKIEDDLITICRAAPGQARPTTFASEPGNGHTLMTYKREKAPGG